MTAALAGDQLAYRHLLKDCQGWLTSYYRKRIHGAMVEDLVQDTLLTLHAKRHTFNADYAFGPWLAAIARHRLIDYVRSSFKYVACELSEDHPADDARVENAAQHDLDNLLGLLPATQAQVIRLVKLQGLSVEEVAKRTGHSPSSIKVMVHRGLKKLMAEVAKV